MLLTDTIYLCWMFIIIIIIIEIRKTKSKWPQSLCLVHFSPSFSIFFFFIPVDGDCVGGFQDLRALSGPGSHLIHFQWGLSASLLVSPHTKWNSLSKAWLCMYPLTSDEARWGRRVSAEENVAVHSLLYACRGEGMFARWVKINLASTLCETVLQKQTKKNPTYIICETHSGTQVRCTYANTRAYRHSHLFS